MMKLLGLGKGSTSLNLALGLFFALASISPGRAFAAGETRAFTSYKGHRVHLVLFVDGKRLTNEASNPIKGVTNKVIYDKINALLSSKGDPKEYRDLSFDEDGQIIFKGHLIKVQFVYMAKTGDADWTPLPEFYQITWYRKVREPLLAREEARGAYYDFHWWKGLDVRPQFFIDGKEIPATDFGKYGNLALIYPVMDRKQPIPNLRLGLVGELLIDSHKVLVRFEGKTKKKDAQGNPVFEPLSWVTNDFMAQKLLRQSELTAKKVGGKKPAPPAEAGGNPSTVTPPTNAGGNPSTVTPPTNAVVGPELPDGSDAKTTQSGWGDGTGTKPTIPGAPQDPNATAATDNRNSGQVVTIPDPNGAGPTSPTTSTEPVGTAKPSPFPRTRSLKSGDCKYQFQEQSEGVFNVFIPEKDGSLVKLFSIPGNLKSIACRDTSLALVIDRINRESELRDKTAESRYGSNVSLAEVEQGAVPGALCVIRDKDLVLLRRMGPSGQYTKVAAADFADGNSGFRFWVKDRNTFTVDALLSPAKVRGDLFETAPTESEFYDAN